MITRRRAGALVISALVLCGLAVGGIALMGGGANDDKPSTAPTSEPSPTRALPEWPSKGNRVVIPTIDVDAPMLAVGTNSKGAQEVPSSLDATGWWREGSKPGQRGNAVIVGHTASKGHGVFDNLGDLDRGDTVKVSYGTKLLTYTVTKEQVVEVSKFATVADEIYRRTGPGGIVLMTCGDWDGTRYETTVIVTAKLAA